MRCASSAAVIVVNDGRPYAHCGSPSALWPWRKRAGQLATRRANLVEGSTVRACRWALAKEARPQHLHAGGWHA
eukprot:5562047-Pleurochrysis_carterae.AAC.1